MIPSDLEGRVAEEASGLSKARVHSSIPRTTDSEESQCPASSSNYWLYPSQEMFYNAMKKKGSHPNPQDMQLVVNIHNIVNEQCWIEILKWEGLHQQYDSNWRPSLA